MTALNRLQTALELIRRYGWIQGRPGSPERGFCLLGAVSYSLHLDGEAYRQAESVIRKIIGTHISFWNDAPERRRSEVESVLIQAIHSLGGTA